MAQDMPPVTRCEPITAETTTPDLEGTYHEHTYEGYAWRCDTCGLVWPKRHQARRCTARGHVATYQDGPYGVQRVENGQPVGHLHYYPREALRRDPVAAPGGPRALVPVYEPVSGATMYLDPSATPVGVY